MNLVKKYQRGGGAGYDDYIIQSTRSKNQQLALKEAYEEARYQKFLERLAATDGIIELAPGQYMRTQKVKRPSKADYLQNSAIYETMLSNWENQQAKITKEKTEHEQSIPVISTPTQTTTQAEMNKKIYNENQRQQAMQAMAQRGYGIDSYDPNGTASMQRASEMAPEVARVLKDDIVHRIKYPLTSLAGDVATLGDAGTYVLKYFTPYNQVTAAMDFRDARAQGDNLGMALNGAFALTPGLGVGYGLGKVKGAGTSPKSLPAQGIDAVKTVVSKGKQAVKTVSQAGEQAAQKIGRTLYEGTPLETTWNQMIDAQTGKLYNNIIDYFNNRMPLNLEAQPVYMVQPDGSVAMGLPNGRIGMTQNMGLVDRLAERVAKKITAEKPSTTSSSSPVSETPVINSNGQGFSVYTRFGKKPIRIEKSGTEGKKAFKSSDGTVYEILEDGRTVKIGDETYTINDQQYLEPGTYGNFTLSKNADGSFNVIGSDGIPVSSTSVENLYRIEQGKDGNYYAISKDKTIPIEKPMEVDKPVAKSVDINGKTYYTFGEGDNSLLVETLPDANLKTVEIEGKTYQLVRQDGKYYAKEVGTPKIIKINSTEDLSKITGFNTENLPTRKIIQTDSGPIQGVIINNNTPSSIVNWKNFVNDYWLNPTARYDYKAFVGGKPFKFNERTVVKDPHGKLINFTSGNLVPWYNYHRWGIPLTISLGGGLGATGYYLFNNNSTSDNTNDTSVVNTILNEADSLSNKYNENADFTSVPTPQDSAIIKNK